jgi:hypothetical protein
MFLAMIRVSLFLSTPLNNPSCASSVEFVSLARNNAPFMTFSPLALWQMKSSGIDPLTFGPANQAASIVNLF